MITKVRAALSYDRLRRVKNSPWVFTNPKMVGIYRTGVGKRRYAYRVKFK
jgi:hypothetical protein